MVDGVISRAEDAHIPVDDPAVTHGWSVFETFVAPTADVDVHLERLASSAASVHITMPSRSQLLSEVEAVLGGVGDAARVRITLTGGGRRIVRAEPIDPDRRYHPVTAARGEHRDEPFLGGSIKHGSRLPWIMAERTSGADVVLLVDASGRFTEGTACGVLAVVDGTLYTAPNDGRILPSTTVAEIVRTAERVGVPVLREGPPAHGPWDGLYVASATRHLAPVVEIDGVALSGWEPIGRRLAGLQA